MQARRVLKRKSHACPQNSGRRRRQNQHSKIGTALFLGWCFRAFEISYWCVDNLCWFVFWDYFGICFLWFWDCVGMIVWWLFDVFGIIIWWFVVGLFLIHFGTICCQYWDCFENVSSSFVDHFGIVWESFWDQLGIYLGYRFGICFCELRINIADRETTIFLTTSKNLRTCFLFGLSCIV